MQRKNFFSSCQNTILPALVISSGMAKSLSLWRLALPLCLIIHETTHLKVFTNLKPLPLSSASLSIISRLDERHIYAEEPHGKIILHVLDLGTHQLQADIDIVQSHFC